MGLLHFSEGITRGVVAVLLILNPFAILRQPNTDNRTTRERLSFVTAKVLQLLQKKQKDATK